MDIQRPILVNDLEDTAHRMYGMLPNMTYTISSTGKVLFRSDWTYPPTREIALDCKLAARQSRKKGLPMAPFYAELVSDRLSDLAKHHKVLKQA